MDKLTLPRPILFLEFFVRETLFKGKGTQRAALPAYAAFYTGDSTAKRYHLSGLAGWTESVWNIRERDIHPHAPERTLSFINGIPSVSHSSEHQAVVQRWIDENIHAVLSVEGEFFYQNGWIRRESGIKACIHPDTASVSAPHGFRIIDVEPDGTVWTDFPRPEAAIKIAPGKTVCFLCRREEYLFGYDEAHDRYQPNLNLVMFVKNNGFHQEVHCVSQRELDAHDASQLCKNGVTIKDFRKSRLRYELG